MGYHSSSLACLPRIDKEAKRQMESERSKSLEFKIPADTRYISLVRRGVRSLAESVGFAKEDVADVEVAVSEAVTNSVVHGSPNRDSAAVVVKCCVSDDCLTVEIEDHGEVDAIPPCPDYCNLDQERGRGVLMMHVLMDECERRVQNRGCGSEWQR